MILTLDAVEHRVSEKSWWTVASGTMILHTAVSIASTVVVPPAWVTAQAIDAGIVHWAVVIRSTDTLDFWHCLKWIKIV